MIPSTGRAIRKSMTGIRSSRAVAFLDLLEQQCISLRFGLLGDAVERLGDPEVAQASRDDAQGVRPALDEAPRDRARLETDLSDRCFYGGPRLRGNIRSTV